MSHVREISCVVSGLNSPVGCELNLIAPVTEQWGGGGVWEPPEGCS